MTATSGRIKFPYLRSKPYFLLFSTLIFTLLSLLSYYNFLLFHSLVELFSVIVAFSIFIISANSNKNSGYFYFLGIAYTFIGGIDLLHTLAYSGMGVFTNFTANLPTQLWILARYVESISLLLAALYLNKNRPSQGFFLFAFFIVIFFVLSIFMGWFPDCFLEGEGLTNFKIISEYVIIILLFSAGICLYNKNDKFSDIVYPLIEWSVIATIISELFFTFYIDIYGISNIIGHLLKLLSFYLLYKAIVESSLRHPFNTIYYDLKTSEKHYRNLFNNTGTAIAVIQFDGLILKANHQMEDLSGYNKSELEGNKNFKNLIAYQTDFEKMSQYHQIRRQKSVDIRIPSKYEFILKNKSGLKRQVIATVTLIPDSNDSIISLIDISDRKEYEEKIKYIGYHDSLTGLYNRTFFEEELKKNDREGQLPISIIMGDINGLKLVNDGFGHHAGDQVLENVGKILKNSCRRDDIVARWGGDEFAILLPKTDSSAVKRIVARINRACLEIENEFINHSIAIGYATKTEMVQDIQETVKKAEKWVYKRKLVESESVRSSIISSLQETLWEKDFETKEHADRIKKLALKIGQALDLPDNVLDEIDLLATLHDIGKIAISESIIRKPDRLNKTEWEKMQKHTEIGYRIAQSSLELAIISQGILHHHEWWDGSGYPHGIKGEEIPLIARIIAIVDAYDVMTHERPYKNAVKPEQAMKELQRCAGTQFDPKLVKVFIDNVVQKSI